MNRTIPALRALPLVLICTVPIATAAKADLEEGLVAHWKFDDGEGQTVRDSAGGHHGVNHGATRNKPGVIGAAAHLDDEKDEFIDCGDGIQLDDGNQATIAAWVRPESFRRPDSRNQANSRNGVLGDSETRLIFTLTDRGRLEFVWDAGGRQFQSLVTDEGDRAPLGEFSHVTAVRNGSTMALYIDGQLKKIGSSFSADRFVRLGRMQIGRVNGSAARDFHGCVDDVRVYRRALSAAEMGRLARAARASRRPFGVGRLERLKYNNPGLVVDLGVGLWAWPLPMDFDADGDLDLLVSCHDVPHSGTYFFENPGGDAKFPVFKPGVLIGGGLADVRVSRVGGEVLDKFTWFENIGARTEPKYAPGRLLTCEGETLRMSLCMIVPCAIDWDRDGDIDLVVGQEDGRVALVENTGRVIDRMPVFRRPRFFQQEADEVKFGALATPVGFDWDGDGDDDIVTGNTEGQIGLIENLGGDPPRWAAPQCLEAGGRQIRIEAGYNGSIQGPCEAKWGYTTLSVADWDHDGLPDIVANSIWGKVHWYRNAGSRRRPQLEASRPIEVEWVGEPPKPAWNWWRPEGKTLATQWRTTPAVVDWTGDGLNDLVMLDHKGYLALFERRRVGNTLQLLPPKRAFVSDGPSVFDGGHAVRSQEQGVLRLNDGVAGRSGRRKLCLADWDRDGRLDLLVNSRSVDLLRNAGDRSGRVVLKPMGPLDPRRLAGHDTSPTVVDWDANGWPDLLVGAEDGFFYYLKNPQAATKTTGF